MKKYLQTFLGIMFAIILSLMMFTTEAKAAIVTSGDWKYEISNGGAYIKGYVGTATEIVIPNEIDGYLIRGISANAFKDNVNMTSVTIPVNIENIGANAFKGCVQLSKVNFNAKRCTVASVSASNDGIFSGAGSSADGFVVNFGDTVEVVPRGVLNSNVEDGKKYAYVTEINLSNEIKEIEGYAFEDCRVLKSITIGTGIEKIGEYAFGDCDDLQSIILNDNLLNIEKCAFYGCDDLQTVTFGSNLSTIGNYAFENCISLEKAIMQNKLTKIGFGAFLNCTKLSEVTIPESVVEIEGNAFKGCVLLSKVNFNAKRCAVASVSSSNQGIFSGAGSSTANFVFVFGDKVEIVPDEVLNTTVENGNAYAYVTEVKISDSVKEIESYAFEDCRALKSITIGANVEKIGEYAFCDCDDLKSIVLNNNLLNIEKCVFYGCDDLQTVTFGSNLSTIGNYAFEDCISLEKAIMQNKLTKIGFGAFLNCTKLSEVTIPESVVEIEGNAFKGCVLLSQVNFNAKRCAVASISSSNDGIFSGAGSSAASFVFIFGDKVEIVPDEVLNTNAETGKSYAYVTEVKLSNSIREIEGYAFEDCRALKSITIGANVEKIGEYAFGDCDDLKTIVFHKNLKEISNYAFNSCNDLEKITVKSASVSVGEKAFSDCNSNMTVECYYGSGLKEAAEKAGCKYSYITPDEPALSKVENVSKGVKLKWKKVIGAEGYIILIKVGNGSYKEIAKVKNTESAYTDKKASAGKSNTYTVQAYAGKKKSTYNKTGLKTIYLKATTISSVENGDASITIKWKKVTGAKEYKIYRSKGSGDYTLLKKVKGTSYTDKKSIKNGTKYRYKIVASNSKYNSVYSGEKTTYYLDKTSFSTKKSTAKGTLSLKWKKNTKASGYQIMYTTSSSLKNPKYVKVSGSKNVSKVIKKLKSNKNYYVCIRTYKTVSGKTYYSGWSKKVKVKIK